MTKTRLEAFSDGVIAILITIMVLELRPPHGADVEALIALWPVFLAYLLSFVLVGIYWNNHHHLLHAAKGIDARIMWSNHALMFFLSLVPFATAWMGEEHDAPLPCAVYGGVMVMCALSFTALARGIVAHEGPDSTLAKALARDGNRKGSISLVLYLSSIPAAWVSPWLSDALFFCVALLWLVPDRRIEAELEEKHAKK